MRTKYSFHFYEVETTPLIVRFFKALFLFLFTVIVTEQTADAVKALRQGTLSPAEALFPPALGLVCTLGSLLLVGKDSFLLLAMALMLAGFFLRYRGERGGERA